MAGAMLALALQLSVLYQMSLRLTLEVNSRMSSAESLLEYTDSFPLEDQREKAEPTLKEWIFRKIFLNFLLQVLLT